MANKYDKILGEYREEDAGTNYWSRTGTVLSPKVSTDALSVAKGGTFQVPSSAFDYASAFKSGVAFTGATYPMAQYIEAAKGGGDIGIGMSIAGDDTSIEFTTAKILANETASLNPTGTDTNLIRFTTNIATKDYRVSGDLVSVSGTSNGKDGLYSVVSVTGADITVTSLLGADPGFAQETSTCVYLSTRIVSGGGSSISSQIIGFSAGYLHDSSVIQIDSLQADASDLIDVTASNASFTGAGINIDNNGVAGSKDIRNDDNYWYFTNRGEGVARELLLTPSATPIGNTSGLMYYDSDTNKFTFNENSSWVSFLTSADALWATDGSTISPVFGHNEEVKINNNFIIGDGSAVDYTITFNGTAYDGVLSWLQATDMFSFLDDVLIPTGESLYFRDTAISLTSLDDGHLDLTADIQIDLNAITLATDKIIFTQIDGNEYIDSLNDGYVDIGATTGIRLNAPVTVNSVYTLPAADGTNAQVLTTNGSGAVTWEDTGAGSGDVVGPASAVDSNLAMFDTTTGKLIKDSLIGAVASGSNTFTFPTSSQTLAGLTAVQTFSGKTFSDALTVAQIATPANPAASYNKLYAKSDNYLYILTSAGVESKVGSGDVVGPASAVDSNLAMFDTTTGKLIKDSLIGAVASGSNTYTFPASTSTLMSLGLNETVTGAKTFSNTGNTLQTTTLAAAATTLALTKNVVVLTGDGGGNTLATITGGLAGQRLTIIFVDALITITDTDAHTADTVDLSAAFTSADDTVLELIYDGTSWYEISRSVN